MEFPNLFMLLFVRQTLCVLCVGTIVLLILRRVHSPTVHRLSCGCVLLLGVCFIHLPGMDVLESASSRHETAPRTESDNTDEASRIEPIDHAYVSAVLVENHSVSPATTSPPNWIAESIRFGAPFIQKMGPWFIGSWLAGAMVIFGWSVACYWRFHKRLIIVPSKNAPFIAKWNAILQSVQQRNVPLMISEDIGPAVVRRPMGTVLVVPTGFLESLTDPQREAVFIHEAQHLKRHDLEWSLAIRFLLLIQWFNPVSWLLARRFDEAAEWACDDVCRKRLPGEAVGFANAVLANTQATAVPLPQLASGMASHNLTTRIRRLLSNPQKESPMKRITLFSVIGLFAIISMCETWTSAIAQEATLSNNEPEASEDSADSLVTVENLTGQQLIDRAIERQAIKPENADGNRLTVREDSIQLVKFPADVTSVTSFDGLVAGVNRENPRLLAVAGKQTGTTSMKVKDENGKTWNFAIEVQKAKEPAKAIPHPVRPDQQFPLKPAIDVRDLPNVESPTGNNSDSAATAPAILKWDMIVCEAAADDRLLQPLTDSFQGSPIKNVSATRVIELKVPSVTLMKTKPTATALLKEAKRLKMDLKLLSVPTVRSLSAQPATLQIGGEFPILIPVTDDTTTIDFYPFGIHIECLGTVTDEGKIRTKLQFENSERDFSSSVTVKGIAVPAIKRYRARMDQTSDAGVTTQIVMPSTEKGRVHLIYVTPSIVAAP